MFILTAIGIRRLLCSAYLYLILEFRLLTAETQWRGVEIDDWLV